MRSWRSAQTPQWESGSVGSEGQQSTLDVGRIKARLRWFGQVHRRDRGRLVRRTQRLELAARRPAGRAESRLMAGVKDDVKFAAERGEDAEEGGGSDGGR